MKTEIVVERLSNAECELEISRATGRIIHYGPVGGGPNVIWNNPRALETASPFDGWINWGGDKVWIWPEADWSKWGPPRPPGDCSAVGEEWEVERCGLSLRMQSLPIPHYGIRIVREISLAEHGSKVTLVNRLEKVAPGTQELPVAVWTVTQVATAPQVFARLCPEAALPGYQNFPESSWSEVELEGRLAILTRPAKRWGKVGLEADLLATPAGPLLFVIQAPAALNDSAAPEFCRRAQVFSDPDDSAFRLPGVPAYLEMEFTSAAKPLALGETLSLTLHWQLLPLLSLNPEKFFPLELLIKTFPGDF